MATQVDALLTTRTTVDVSDVTSRLKCVLGIEALATWATVILAVVVGVIGNRAGGPVQMKQCCISSASWGNCPTPTDSCTFDSVGGPTDGILGFNVGVIITLAAPSLLALVVFVFGAVQVLVFGAEQADMRVAVYGLMLATFPCRIWDTNVPANVTRFIGAGMAIGAAVFSMQPAPELFKGTEMAKAACAASPEGSSCGDAVAAFELTEAPTVMLMISACVLLLMNWITLCAMAGAKVKVTKEVRGFIAVQRVPQ